MLIILLPLFTSVGCEAEIPEGDPTVVRILQTNNGYQLFKDDAPYIINGVGGSSDLKRLKEYGGNTIRTWDAEGIAPLMDEAHELGIMVVVGIWLEHARHGFDYSQPESKDKQLMRVSQFVHEFKDHPALLAWGVGNELELGGSMDGALLQINDAAELIKSIDTNHPTMAVIAEIGDDKAIRIQNECPNIDFLGINSYGGMGSVSSRLESQGCTMPYAITEFGPVGHWETGLSPWGAPYEQSSAGKAAFIRTNYDKTVQPNLGKQCLGSFAFLWGHKQEKTETWYGLLLPSGETTQSVDVLSELWTGNAPQNKAPIVKSIVTEADLTSLKPAQRVSVTVDAIDPDDDTMTTQWRVIPESTQQSAGGDFESAIVEVELVVETHSSTHATITMPSAPGAYRIFVTLRDGHNHAGTANLPILVVQD